MGGKLRRRTAPRVTRTTILLVTNGEKTEKSYLEGIRRRVPRGANLSITVGGENGKEPETIVRNLTRSQGGLDEYDEVWIVVDHDGKDRQGFLDACRKVRGTRMVGIVSTPCFEVWLNAHYERVQKYRDQEALHATDRTHRVGGQEPPEGLSLRCVPRRDATMLPDGGDHSRGE